MCTVTYLPIDEGFILTSNRDESPWRNATPPEDQKVAGHDITFPKDPLAGGTWFATDNKRFTLVLLNGGIVKHHHQPPYRRSRGLMVLDFFETYQVESFVKRYDFRGIEPFTLVIIEQDALTKVHELVWTEEALIHNKLDSQSPSIWSSSTLYPESVREERRDWFKNWLQEHQSFNQEAIIQFHKNGGKGDAWNDFIMNRNGIVQTISITSVMKNSKGFQALYHEDLLNKKGA